MKRGITGTIARYSSHVHGYAILTTPSRINLVATAEAFTMLLKRGLKLEVRGQTRGVLMTTLYSLSKQV